MPGGYNTGRPDIGMSRGQPDFNDAENMEGNFSNLKFPDHKTRNESPHLKDILSGLKTNNSSK